MKTLVAYYSRKNSNRYLAEKIAGKLDADIEEIRPRINSFGLFLMNVNPGIRKIKYKIPEYDRVILVGPIWMGRFVPPLKSFVTRYRKDIRELIFVTCCGSTYDKKDEKYGHGLVFEKVKEIMGDKLVLTQAFPVGLVMPEGEKDDPEAFMKTHLSDSNFNGEIEEIFNGFMKKIA